MNYLDKPYLAALDIVRSNGVLEDDRTKVGCYALPGAVMANYDIADNFPLFTHKKMGFIGILKELMWFLSGSTNAKVLEDQGVNIWRDWGGEDREMGPIYGAGWRRFSVPFDVMGLDGRALDGKVEIDQLQNLLTALVKEPTSRRHVVTLWNPHTWRDCALPCCHGTTIQFKRQFINGYEYLHCSMTQRSNDMFLGVPYNVASYSLLTYLIASWLGIRPGIFSHTMNDAHIYANHLEQVAEAFSRPLLPSPKVRVTWSKECLGSVHKFCQQVERIIQSGYSIWSGDEEKSSAVLLPKKKNILISSDSLSVCLEDYLSHPPIKAEVAV